MTEPSAGGHSILPSNGDRQTKYGCSSFEGRRGGSRNNRNTRGFDDNLQSCEIKPLVGAGQRTKGRGEDPGVAFILAKSC